MDMMCEAIEKRASETLAAEDGGPFLKGRLGRADVLLCEYLKWGFSLGVALRRRDLITLLGGPRNDAPHNSRCSRARAAILE
jgi:hypothetical protein